MAIKNILVVDDSATERHITGGILTKGGYTVTFAEDGESGIAKTKADLPDLVVMDVQMPRMSGYEATAAIRQLERQNGRSTPIVALTAHAVSGDRERCLESGMDDYVTKPIRVEDLTAAIRRACQARSMPSFFNSSA